MHQMVATSATWSLSPKVGTLCCPSPAIFNGNKSSSLPNNESPVSKACRAEAFAGITGKMGGANAELSDLLFLAADGGG